MQSQCNLNAMLTQSLCNVNAMFILKNSRIHVTVAMLIYVLDLWIMNTHTHAHTHTWHVSDRDGKVSSDFSLVTNNGHLLHQGEGNQQIGEKHVRATRPQGEAVCTNAHDQSQRCTCSSTFCLTVQSVWTKGCGHRSNHHLATQGSECNYVPSPPPPHPPAHYDERPAGVTPSWSSSVA